MTTRVVDQRVARLVEFPGPAQHIHLRKFPEDVRAIAVGHTPDDADDQVRLVAFRSRSSPSRDQTFCSACSRTEHVL